MESAAVRLYFLLEHNYSLVTMSCILHIIWVNSCTINKINFSKDNIARGLCTLVLFIFTSYCRFGTHSTYGKRSFTTTGGADVCIKIEFVPRVTLARDDFK